MWFETTVFVTVAIGNQYTTPSQKKQSNVIPRQAEEIMINMKQENNINKNKIHLKRNITIYLNVIKNKQ